jgi:hypothetical protein
MSGVSPIQATISSPQGSSQRLRGGRGFTATVPSFSCRQTNRIAELGLTSKRAAAWRRDMPEDTFFTIRIRKSCEIVVLNPPSEKSNHEYWKSQSKKDKSGSINLGNALAEYLA